MPLLIPPVFSTITLGYIFEQIITTNFELKKLNTINLTETVRADIALALSW